MYVALGVNFSGKKEFLGLWLDETQGAKFWLSCLTDLKNRGLNDIFVVCVDGLRGFPEAIQTAYPKTKVGLSLIVYPLGDGYDIIDGVRGTQYCSTWASKRCHA